MDDYIVFDDCTLPSLCAVEKYIEGLPRELVAKTIDYIKRLQGQGVDVKTVKYVLTPVNYDLSTGYETGLEYLDSQGKIVNPVLLDNAVGVRGFERTMTEHAGFLISQLSGHRLQDSNPISLSVYEHVVTVEESNNECAALLLVDIDTSDDKNPFILSGDLAEVIRENYRFLEPDSTALMISSEKGLYAEELTASMRIIGEAVRETDDITVQSWLDRASDIFISRIDDDLLMIHGVVYQIISDVSAGPFLALIKG